MSTKICFVDLDGIIANADARFARAKLHADAEMERGAITRKEYQNTYWRAVFNPEYVSPDVLIEGAPDAVSAIEQDGYDVISVLLQLAGCIFDMRPTKLKLFSRSR